MATRSNITLFEGNDTVLNLTVTPVETDQDLTQITILELYLKADNCQDDADAELLLTSNDTDEINIMTHTSQVITAQAFIPGDALTPPYDRFWRLDGVTPTGARQTALYGKVNVVSV